jgi:hypothetical protein
MSASLMMSIRFTLPSDHTRKLFSSIALSHALTFIISIHKAQNMSIITFQSHLKYSKSKVTNLSEFQ